MLPSIRFLLSLVLSAPLFAQATGTLFSEVGRTGPVTRVRIDRVLLRELCDGERDRAIVSLFRRGDVLRVRRVERYAAYSVLHGGIEGSVGSVVLVADRAGRVAAHATVEDRTRTVGYRATLALHEVRDAPEDRGCGVGRASVEPATADTESNPKRRRLGPTQAGMRLVDVVVPYTPLARRNVGGTAAMHNEVRLRIALANVANAGSDVTWRFRLVWTGETNYTEPNPVRLPAILSRLRNPSDGFMDEVHGIRNRFGGDVVAMICDGLNRDWGGYAYCRSNRASAFSMTHRVGLAAHLLHHEMGHNLGCAHNRANVDCSGSYSYSYGWRTPDNKYHTVMSYRAGNSQRVNHWSSPNVLVLNYVMGTATEDNVRSLNNRGPIVAGFSPTIVLEWCELEGGIRGAVGYPRLLGSGTITDVTPPRLAIENVPANTPGLLVVGARQLNLPLLGGTLVPSLDVVMPLVVTANTSADVSFVRLLRSGADVWFQGFFLDGRATQGWSASHAVKTRVP